MGGIAHTFKQFVKKESKFKATYWLTRYIFLRSLGVVYFFAFLGLVFQVLPLIGSNGLLPAEQLLTFVGDNMESSFDAFWQLPTLFWLNVSDSWLIFFAWIGLLLSIALILGCANSIMMGVLWFVYLSYVHIGQTFYSFGWEMQLLETGFLAIFFVPLLDGKPFPKKEPPIVIIWLLRWLTFRVYFGAGLIKLRGDECWTNLTCLQYHYETQPIPNPLSPWYHFLPKFMHTLGVLWNHLIELIVPFLVFWPRILRLIAGLLLLSFQIFLMTTGNYSFLNLLTLVGALALFDDQFLAHWLPKKLVERAKIAEHKKVKWNRAHTVTLWVVFCLILFLSIPVVQNLASSNQIMNTSFNSWNIVNTYGLFGSIGKDRLELVVQGTDDAQIGPETQWKEYGFKAKPTDLNRNHVVIAPYQPRIDWQIWFAAFSSPQQHPWLIHMVWKLLHNDPGTLALLAENPFPDQPPKIIRIELHRYEFAPIGADQRWEREYIGEWLRPLSADTEGFRQIIASNGWNTYPAVQET